MRARNQLSALPSSADAMAAGAKLPAPAHATAARPRPLAPPPPPTFDLPAGSNEVSDERQNSKHEDSEDDVGDDKSKLTEEQRKVYDAAMAGQSVFFTGSAGTGKSFLLRVLVESLRSKLGHDAVFITASTGIAACNVGGLTIHSFAGVGLAREDARKLADKVTTKSRAAERWRKAKVLFIDEVSMLDGELFDKLEYVARRVRNNGEVFGGLQVLLSGDFFQLPPVGIERADVSFCFQAKCWDALVTHEFVLQRVFRQRDDTFINLLNSMRSGKVSPEAATLLEDAGRGISKTSDLRPTLLFSTNHRVDATNERRLRELGGASYVFRAMDSGTGAYASHLAKNCRAPQTLTLKVGAQVMLLQNLNVGAGLVNGARGVVKAFENPSGDSDSEDADFGEAVPVVQFGTGRALLIAHVAASLAHTLPCVLCSPPEGAFQRRIRREEFSVVEGGKTVARRLQLPLKLAWALSIHKSQGMTINCLEVDLSNIFEPGQAYVALSRGTALESESAAAARDQERSLRIPSRCAPY